MSRKVEVLGDLLKKGNRVKFYPGRYLYARKFRIFLELEGIRKSTFEKDMAKYRVPRETARCFLSGRHVPSSWLTHLIEDHYGIRFHHEDFEPGEAPK
jgi:hypothetical protein